MRTVTARGANESSAPAPAPVFSFSKLHFKWVVKKTEDGGGREEEEISALSNGMSSSSSSTEESSAVSSQPQKKRGMAARRMLRTAFMSAMAAARIGNVRAVGSNGGLGSKVTGTLFGHRRGHVHFAFQVDPKSPPVVLIELATPTSGLVREMASGLVRIALECERKDKKEYSSGGAAKKLLEEDLWRTFCNGKKCGYAVRRECGPSDWNVLRAVEPVSMGAGVLPAVSSKIDGGMTADGNGEMMYMRARFERVVGSKDSEAFYMMNPDSNGGPELSIYLLRV
ncbi:hypothetical protein ZOSMA_199G00150 [Zostera marina]|uniref:Protein MIZU-KUSSEI 1 n=1 Tax=Zostera marina TaxID=29655 RepID=A0A0K9PND3_ZOSMR|nr:hypothetical protein ZOSMA_199G00150 [Zostera marina]